MSCVVTDEPVSETEQKVCNSNNDDCINGHPLTLAEAKAEAKAWAAWKEQLAGVSTPTPNTTCGHSGVTSECHSKDWVNPYQYVETNCTFLGNGMGASCNSVKCTFTGSQNGDSCVEL
jgi:hypothetical protein